MSENVTEFDKNKIRHQFDENSNKWHFSIVDIIAMTTKSSDPRNYWKVLKNRLKKAQNELVTECNQLKMMASDGKYYLTDTGNENTIQKILGLISPKHIEEFEEWFKNLKVAKSSQNHLPEVPPGEEKENIEQEEFMLLVDGYYENNIIVVQAFAAGIDIESLSISATSSILTIKGERKIEKNISENDYYEQELYWGKFSRTVMIPHEIEIDQIVATSHHGLITITLPIIEKNKSRTIKVKALEN